MTYELKCPKCGSTNVVFHDCYDTDYGAETYEELCYGYCTDCNADIKWKIVYKFIGYDNIISED